MLLRSLHLKVDLPEHELDSSGATRGGKLTRTSASLQPRSLRSRSIRLGPAFNLSSTALSLASIALEGLIPSAEALTVPIQYDNNVCRCAQPATCQLGLHTEETSLHIISNHRCEHIASGATGDLEDEAIRD